MLAHLLLHGRAGRLVLLLFAGAFMGPLPARAQPIVPLRGLPSTPAEASGFTRTSTFEQVWAWIDTLQARGAPMRVYSIGQSAEGRSLPLVVLSRPLVSGPDDARAAGKPVIYLQGNIHAGEVEGKDALLMLMRDLTLGEARALLDRVVLLINPIYNPDGNERWAPVGQNRRGQDGPEEVGIRANAMGLDLNRDCTKAESPEFRHTLARVLNVWQPDVVVDLHTTNGSYHGYDLTYAACLTPTAPAGPVTYTDQRLLPEIRRRLADRGHPLFDYGNFSGGYPPTQWRTFSWEPRYVSNYNGVRGSISILSEAVSYRPFRTRVSATYWFVREIIDYSGTHAAPLREVTAAARRQVVAWGTDPARAPELGVRFTLTSRGSETVAYEVMATPEGGQRRERTGTIAEAPMEIFTRFEATRSRPFPAGYIIPAGYPEAVENLMRHGIQVERLLASWQGQLQTFRVDSLYTAARPYQGYRMVSVEGDWIDRRQQVPAGAWFVPTAQPLGALVFTLLEPEINDGLLTWGFFDRGVAVRRDAPVLKLMKSPDVPRRVAGPGDLP